MTSQPTKHTLTLTPNERRPIHPNPLIKHTQVAPAPGKLSRGRGVARMAVDEMLGADVETGGVFDPLVGA